MAGFHDEAKATSDEYSVRVQIELIKHVGGEDTVMYHSDTKTRGPHQPAPADAVKAGEAAMKRLR